MSRKKLILIALLLSLLSYIIRNQSNPSTVFEIDNGIVKECSEIKVAKQVKTGIELECLGNGKQTLIQSSLRGPMLINVYGSWCWPCREEIPYFRDFYEKYQEQVGLVGIAVEEVKKSDTTDFIKSMGIKWPSLYDPDGRTRLNFGMGVPVTLFVDAKGKVVGKIVGAVKDAKTLVEESNKYLKLNLQ